MRTSRNSASNWRSARWRSASLPLCAHVTSSTCARPRSSRARSASAGRSSSTARTRERTPRAHAARTPARNFGSVIVTVVPSPCASLDLEPVVAAEARLQPGLDVREPDAAAVTGEDLAPHARCAMPTPSSRTRRIDVRARVAADDRDPPVAAALDPVANRVLDERLQRQHRYDDLKDLGCDLDSHLELRRRSARARGAGSAPRSAARRRGSRRGARRGTRSA